eukprot:354387-Pleurochrysis_carterae.AAC.1
MEEELLAEDQCTYALLTGCSREGLNGQALRKCVQCGSEGMHHHMCAVSNEELEQKSAVPNSSDTKCA